MIKYLIRRLVQLVVVLFVVTFLAFLLISLLPGKPQDVLVPFSTDTGNAHTEQVIKQEKAKIVHELGLDRSIPAQYAHWINGLVHGNFGSYYRVSGNDPVSTRLASHLPVSLQLMVYAQVLTLLIAIPLGVYTAYRSGKRDDRFISGLSYAALALPNFVLALILSYYIGVKLGWLAPNGYVHPSQSIIGHIKSMIMPTVSLALAQVAIYMRLLRSDMIQTLQEDFVLVAKAKGVKAGRVLWRHALRPSSLTLLTVAGLNVGTLIGGAVVLEVIFQLPGMGTMMFEAIGNRQYVALQSCIVVIAAGYVVANFLVDMLYTALDPRIRSVSAAS